MAYKKIYIAIDCQSDAEVVAVQDFGKELSQLLQLKASDVLKIAPMVRKNSALLIKTAKVISSEGAVGVAKMIPYFIANVKK
ncbi:MAG: hypothetical protein IKK89_04765 [Alistipes sp.]|nr:hypothetical protein [Alistipes sp.]MBR6631239.1 hypothetical protein [Alistipes sp.]